MSAKVAERAQLIPVHVAHWPPADDGDVDARTPPRDRGARARSAGIDWASHGVEPRWLGMETSDCVAAFDPSIFDIRGATELKRFLSGAGARGESALIIATIGDVNDDTRSVFGGSGHDSILLPGMQGSINGVRLPSGAQPALAPDLSNADRDLGLRLRNRSPDAPWWSISLGGLVMEPGAGGPAERQEPDGRLEPILVDGLGNAVVAAWTPASGDQRWYVLPDATDWNVVIPWLVQQALPTHVPGALRRARSPYALDPGLQTRRESAAREAIADMEAAYEAEKFRLEAELQEATAAAEPIRYGLLYGTGAELVAAVASVLRDAGFKVVDVDALLGDTSSADLLVSYDAERRLVEVKSASGNAAEALVGHLERHIDTWPQLRPGEPVGGGVLIVNHQHKHDPNERAPEVYTRTEFVGALVVPVISTLQLFRWWRESDWPAIREALLRNDS